MTTIAARWPGTCPDCGGRWQEGDLICPDPDEPQSGVWVHWTCPDAAQFGLKRGEAVCTTCQLIHPAGVCDR